MLSLPVVNSSLGFGEPDCSAHPSPHARVSELSVEHHDLDAAIDALVSANAHDGLTVARLKKRRLQIRDEIANIAAAAQMRDASIPDDAIPLAQSDAEMDALRPHTSVAAASKSAGGSFAFGVFVTLLFLLLFWPGWSETTNSLSQTAAQLYLLSLLVAANG